MTLLNGAEPFPRKCPARFSSLRIGMFSQIPQPCDGIPDPPGTPFQFDFRINQLHGRYQLSSEWVGLFSWGSIWI